MWLRSMRIIALVLVMTLSPAGVRAFGVNDVIKLQKEQVSDSLIVLAIQKSGQVIRVGSDDFRRLKQAGVSDQVMSALLRSEQVGFQNNVASHGNAYGWAYDPYGPYFYPRSSLSLAFSYGYGGYLWPGYRPYLYRYRPYVGLHYRYPLRRW
jgi:hypothetical protein